MKEKIGIVVIGRNEGDRLRVCLESLDVTQNRVYVDSGSTDNSIALARSLGAATVPLAPDTPFTAARARNAGIRWLLEHCPDLELIQTLDGDCALAATWISVAMADIEADPRRAVVFGRRAERYPDRNAYHRACDDEWEVQRGPVNSCGGDALFRVAALREVGGYNDTLIAGEEPDLCLRLRQRGWQIWSNGKAMTLHDVAMSRFQQWWHRSRRTGYAISELVDLHGSAADPAWRRLLASAALWSLMLVFAAIGTAVLLFSDQLLARSLAVLPIGVLVLQIARLTMRKRSRFGVLGALQWTALLMAAKVAQVTGSMQYKLQRRSVDRTGLIEYKT